jgi:hypothetical protein
MKTCSFLAPAPDLRRSRWMSWMPMHEGDRLVGMITDRDIAVRVRQ